VLDLRIGILTHPASKWDAERIERDCLAALAGENLSIQVRVFSNPQAHEPGLTPVRYLAAALAAQWRVGNVRLGKHFSLLTLSWHVRQLVGLFGSLVRLVLPAYRDRVSTECIRAARISQGHCAMWAEASQESARLHLFLEDDVILASPEALVKFAQSLLEREARPSQFIGECSHSYSLREIGVDHKSAIGNQQAQGFEFYNFPFTNTLAASFVSPELLSLTVAAFLDGRVGRGLGIDLELMQLWSRREFKAASCIATNQVFLQQSGFRSQKI
jgi:hypothetical protein